MVAVLEVRDPAQYDKLGLWCRRAGNSRKRIKHGSLIIAFSTEALSRLVSLNEAFGRVGNELNVSDLHVQWIYPLYPVEA